MTRHTQPASKEQLNKPPTSNLAWSLFVSLFVVLATYRLLLSHYRTAIGILGVGALLWLSMVAWRERRLALLLLLLVAVWILAQWCSVLLVLDVRDLMDTPGAE
jgi:hypothetical protein